jgi:hypothetical protein
MRAMVGSSTTKRLVWGRRCRAEGEVEIPEEHLPAAVGGFIGELILAAVVAVAVPVADDATSGEDAHPLFDIDEGFDGLGVGIGAGVLRASTRANRGE